MAENVTAIQAKASAEHVDQKKPVLFPLIGHQDLLDISKRQNNLFLFKYFNNVKPFKKRDAEIVPDIDEVYFNNSDYDIARFELEKLTDVFNKTLIAYNVTKLRAQHEIAEKQCLQLITKNKFVFDGELDRIRAVQEDLKSSLEDCEDATNHIKLAKRQITTTGFGLLSYCRHKSLIVNLLNSLKSIKILLQNEKKIEELVSKGNYAEGLALLLKCIQRGSAIKQFTCIAALSLKFQSALIMIEEQLDIILSKMCFNFDHVKYSDVQEAYRHLGKTRVALDHLYMHYISAIHSASFDTINLFVNTEKLENINYSFQVLCQCVPDEQLIPCLTTLSKIFWNMLQSYKKATVWHRKFKANIEENANQEYISNKFEMGSTNLWGIVVSKISNFVFNFNMTKYKFDDFLQILSILNKYLEIGEEFCNSKSEQLKNETEKSCISYFHNYHRNCLYELIISFKNESWTPCPVKREFNLFQLLEFWSIKNNIQQIDLSCLTHSKNPPIDSSSISTCETFHFSSDKSPFDDNLNTTYDEDILDIEMDGNSICSDNTNYSYDEVDSCKIQIDNNNQPPLITNTTLTVMRYCGKYLKICNILKSMSEYVITCLCQLFEYYLYAVHLLFTSDILPQLCNDVNSVELQSVIIRIRDTFIQSNYNNDTNQDQFVREAEALHLLSLSEGNNLYRVSEKIVAVESLIFLGEQYNLFKSYLNTLLTSDTSGCSDTSDCSLQQFYNKTLTVIVDLRKLVYSRMVFKAIGYSQVLSMMNKVNWEVENLMSDNNSYVDYFIWEIRVFFKTLKTSKLNIYLSEQILNSIWDSIGLLVSSVFVEGFSFAMKCTFAGRALMQLDFTQFISEINNFCPIPLPNKKYVEVYIEIYYIPESSLKTWIGYHQEYSYKQLLAVIKCVCQYNRPLRRKLIIWLKNL